MHFFETSKRKVKAWNSVDVLVKEHGPLQHGSVIDVAENGLLIDFYFTAQRAVLVEFGKVFGSESDEESFSPDAKSPAPWSDRYCPPPAGADQPPVQALLRARPEGPWAWSPAKLLMFAIEHSSELFFVEVQLDGFVLRELVLRAQLRYQPSEQEMHRRVIKHHDFITRCVNSATGAVLSRDLSEYFNARSITALSGYTAYLQRRDENPVVADHSRKVFPERIMAL
ncbi:uncharacterized protein LOC129600945 isoform X1 [Paramacrobiotus metropolitanus]|uniref:uncharacterized protein LOC129600945 isoform X1 n=1 Tax=Paramacrobiotus metropolitanus TaxID=2943436 RepID=UPI002445B03B|nr:uncharacterized protein LOC129600945 isoform X1 [Paramacrobiotus metropolitanus]